MTGPPVRTVFFGSGQFAVPILRALAAHPDVRLVGVVTAPPRPAGRRGALSRTPVEVAADGSAEVPVLTPSRLRDPDAVSQVLDLAPELAVLADYGQIVPPPLLTLSHGALNLHPSLLPRHRGATPIPAAILAGDGETGVTLMRMDAGLDTGPIVAQRRVGLRGTETTPGLEADLAALAADLLAERLGDWIGGRLDARPQDEAEVTLTRPLRRADGALDATRPAVALERQVRAYQPWPGSYLETVAGRLVVWRAAVGAAGPPPGTFDDRGLGTADGSMLILEEVQPAGGKRMSWDAYLRGHPSVMGSRVVTPEPDA